MGSSGRELTAHEKKLKKAFWFISISRNAIIVLISALTAFWFECFGYSPFILSGTDLSELQFLFFFKAMKRNLLKVETLN